MVDTPQAPPLPLPIRVLVKGPSTTTWLSGTTGTREDMGFPRSLEAHLYAAGRPAVVHNAGIAADRVKTLSDNWQQEVIAFSPDVIVLLSGQYETIHFLWPWWLERHANSLVRRPGFVRERYRKYVMTPLWMLLARLQAKADTVLDSTLRRGRPRRAVAHVRRFIERAQGVGAPLVLVLEILPPASQYQQWFPGMAERTAVMNAALEEMVADIGKPNVRLIRTSRIVEEHFDSIEEATPDGAHFCPRLHREVGRVLSEEVLAWAQTQPHLNGAAALPPAPVRPARARRPRRGASTPAADDRPESAAG